MPRNSWATPKPRVASAFQSERNWISSKSSAWLHAVCVQGESREIANGVTPASSNSGLLSRRSSSSFVQVDVQAKRKKRKSAARSATRSAQVGGSRGASQTVASGTGSPGASTVGRLGARIEQREHGTGLASGLGLRQRAGGELDDERACAREAMVLPVRRRAAGPAEGPEPHSREPGVAARVRDALPPSAPERLWLV